VPQFIKLNRAYGLIANGEKILVAISGGIDSLILCRTLSEYRLSIHGAVELKAVYVSIPPVALSHEQIEKIADLMTDWQIPFTIIAGSVSANVAFNCYACARERRKQLFRFATENYCDAVAFGHHLDDYLETGLMNLIYHGSLETLHPVQLMLSGRIRVIRPFLNVPKKHIRAYGRASLITPSENYCPFQEENKRQNVREMMRVFTGLNRNFRNNLHRALNRWNQLTV